MKTDAQYSAPVFLQGIVLNKKIKTKEDKIGN